MCPPLPLAMVAQLTQLGAALVAWARAHRDAPLVEQETAVRDAMRTVLPTLLETVVQLNVSDLDPGVRWVARRCPRCACRTRVQGLRPRQVHSRCGVVTLTRPWYHCRSCGHGFSPVDATLDLVPHAHLSPGLRDWVVELGTATVYRDAAALLAQFTGLVVHPDTVREQTTAAGVALREAEQTAIAQVQATAEPAEPVERAPGTLVVEADGVLIRFGREWREVKVGLVGGVVDGDLAAPSYVAAREPAEAFGPRLLAEAARRGALAVERWQGTPLRPGLAVLRQVLVLGDGAPWIWHLAADHFGERIEVVDFYHAVEHLWTVARATQPTEAAAAAWAAAQRHALLIQGVAPVRVALAQLPQPQAWEAAEVLRVERGYFAANAARMDYPLIRAQRLPIGSGAIESSAKHVIQQRMKRPGQRWSDTGGAALCALRARRASGRPLMPFRSVPH